MTEAIQTCIKQITGARAYMGIKLPFYMALLSDLRMIVTESEAVPTAGVTEDGRLFINAHFFAKQPTVAKRAFLLAHEVLHPALGYWARSRTMDHELANIAHDYIINAILRDEEPTWFIEGGCYNEKYKGWTFEEIYADLMKNVQKSAKKQGGGKGAKGGKAGKGGKGGASGSGTGSPGSGDGEGESDGKPQAGGTGMDILTDEQAAGVEGVDVATGKKAAGEGPDAGRSRDSLMREWGIRVMRAALGARAQGRGSLGMDRIVDLSSDSTVPWQEMLRLAVVEAQANSRTDWGYPSRRAEAVGCYMPREEFLGLDVLVYVDSSGSISADNLRVACAETQAIINQAGGRIRWMEGDDGVLKDEWIGAAPETIAGGGGTSFVPVFDHLRDDPPKTLIIFTDTWGAMPDYTPDYPVIWAVFQAPREDVTQRPVPFGEIIPVPDSIGVTGRD